MIDSSQALITAVQLGQLLKAARRRRALTQAQVAARVGLSQNRLSYLEQHPDQVSVKNLLTWCSMVGLELRIGQRSADVATPTEW